MQQLNFTIFIDIIFQAHKLKAESKSVIKKELTFSIINRLAEINNSRKVSADTKKMGVISLDSTTKLYSGLTTSNKYSNAIIKCRIKAGEMAVVFDEILPYIDIDILEISFRTFSTYDFDIVMEDKNTLFTDLRENTSYALAEILLISLLSGDNLIGFGGYTKILQNINSSLNRKTISHDSNKEELEEEIKRLNYLIEHRADTYQELGASNSFLKIENKEISNRLYDCENECNRLKNEIGKLRERKNQESEKNNSLIVENEKLKKENDRLQNEILKMEDTPNNDGYKNIRHSTRDNTEAKVVKKSDKKENAQGSNVSNEGEKSPTVVKKPNFEVETKVKLHGTTEWQKSIKAKPGEKVDYQISYKNTGETIQNNVIVKDKLPSGVKYVNDTTTLKNAAHPEGDGMKVTSNNVTTTGINIGNYGPNANAFVRFTAQLPEAKDLKCGVNKLTNTGSIVTENGTKEDTAIVDIDVE